MKQANKKKRLDKRLENWKRMVTRSQQPRDRAAYHEPGSMKK